MLRLKESLTSAISQALTLLEATNVPVVIEPSSRADFGDWSTPVALRAAKVLRRSPLEIASQLAERLSAMELPSVDRWTVSPPGYVNAWLDHFSWAPAVINEALQLDNNQPLGLAGTFAGKTLLEHTGINTNKAAHVGHLRNACLGDSLAKILRRTDHVVEVANKIDDTGVQVADVVVGISQLRIEQQPNEPFDQYCSRVYMEISKLYQSQPDLKTKRQQTLKEIEQGNNETARYAKDLAKRIVQAQLATMLRFGINYDLLYWESDIVQLGFWQIAKQLLQDSKVMIYCSEGKHAGCWIMPAKDDGSEEDDAKVLIKSDGVATYTAKDIALQLWKFGLLDKDFHYQKWDIKNRLSPVTTTSEVHGENVDNWGQSAKHGKADRVINVIDSRQAYPQQVVQQALERLGYTKQAEQSIHLDYQLVALSNNAAKELGLEVETDRERHALSGRKGIEVRADDLLDRTVAHVREKARDGDTADRLAIGAIRYYLQKFSLNQIITFDFEEALRTTGDTGIYLQYAHARAAGILRKVPEESSSPMQVPEILEPVERVLLHSVDAYELALAAAANNLSPPLLATYAFSLASALNDFYEHTPPVVRETNPVLRQFRWSLVAAARATLADALTTLGIPVMDHI